MSFSAAIHGHIDTLIHDAEAIEKELLAKLEEVVKDFESHVSGSWFTGSHVSSTNLADPTAKVEAALVADPHTGAPAGTSTPESEPTPEGGGAADSEAGGAGGSPAETAGESETGGASSGSGEPTS